MLAVKKLLSAIFFIGFLLSIIPTTIQPIYAAGPTCSSIGVSASFDPPRPVSSGYTVNFTIPSTITGTHTWEIRRRNVESAQGAGWDSGHGYTTSNGNQVSRQFGPNQVSGDSFEHMFVIDGSDYCYITSPALSNGATCSNDFVSVPEDTKINTPTSIRINPSQTTGFSRGEYLVYINDQEVCRFIVDGGGVVNNCGTHNFNFLYATNRLRVRGGVTDPTNYCAITISLTDDGVDVESGNTALTDEYNLCQQIPESTTNSTARDNCNTCLNQIPKGIWTALGCIKADPQSIISSIMQIGLSLAGGVALIMILAAAFLFSTSQGDPKRTSDAKDLLTSAVIGLLFVIFSVTILQFIGVSILRIPDFAV